MAQSKRRSEGEWGGCLLLLVMGCLFVLGCLTAGRRKPMGHCAREIACGQSSGMQRATDLAWDIQNLPELAPLQEWSVQTMARFERHELRTSPPGRVGDFDSLMDIAPEELPAWVRIIGSHSVAIKLDRAGKPECVAFCFFNRPGRGLLVGAPTYTPDEPWWFFVRPRPGIWAYWSDGPPE